MENTSNTLLQRLVNRGDNHAWSRLTELYGRLIRTWLSRHVPQSADVDDLTQQVFTVVVEKFADFQHNGRTGAFRAWLRGICVNRVRMHWRKHPGYASDAEAALRDLEDPHSALSQQWDREHDQAVFKRALELIEPEFKPATFKAFQLVAVEDHDPEAVAAELGLTVNAVFIAKSRILGRLRRELDGLM